MLQDMGMRAKAASRELAKAPGEQKDRALRRLAECLWEDRQSILEANRLDVQAGEKAGLTPALLDRLTLDETRLGGIITDLETVIRLPDPVGEVFLEKTLPNELRVRKQRVPIGVLAVIYESRPNVTIDVAGLAIKSGNCAILRGGSETIHSNRALVQPIRQALRETGLPDDAVQFIDDTDRGLVAELLKMYAYVDMVIPRGGAGLHRYCRENSLIPVITGGIGICHLFVDASADLEQAVAVIRNAKIQRPTVCNALDTVLVHREAAASLLPLLVKTLSNDGVTFRADPSTLYYLGEEKDVVIQPAGLDDFDTEWLSLILGLKVVDGLSEAVNHIAAHSTGHSDGILTSDESNAQEFIRSVDSAVVYVNASTRFTDGGQLGLGAEVAVSTQRLHARGPMALEELTTYKWVVQGDYHVRG